ncbi:acyl-CoA dehydrogenase family protein [Streptomyces sp. NPDC004250]|uniref:acyl-CoA dehydrogenase family protein n=1 Tax=Streptomyces sp. NPDC004250 TaxID=3364692 RepID=UPI003692AB8A
MSWLGPRLDPEQRGLVDMLDALATERGTDLTDDPAHVGALRRELAELGVWTLGVAETHGGGGANQTMTTIALERLGRHWPALALACVHAHAAVDVLGSADGELVPRLHTAEALVAVVEADATHVTLTREGDGVTGSVARVDVTGRPDALIVLNPDRGGLLFDAEALASGPVLRRCGLSGAGTMPLTLNGVVGASVHELALDSNAVRNRLRLGAAAVAAGIAGGAVSAATVYAAGRHQFGGPLTALPTIRASLSTQTFRATTALLTVLAAEAQGTTAASAALIQACEAAVDVSTASLQIHGGYGYLSEYPAERFTRDAVSLRAAVDAAGMARSEASRLVGMA